MRRLKDQGEKKWTWRFETLTEMADVVVKELPVVPVNDGVLLDA